MNNKEMIEYKGGDFISKIKFFFKRLFRKQEKYNNISEEQLINNSVEVKERQNDFINNIKVEIKANDKVSKARKLLKDLDGNEDALNMLSIEKLEKLDKYYDRIIEKNNEKIKKLKATF